MIPGRANITLVCGGSGSGKTAWLIRQIKKAKRVLVWDMKGEYARDHGFRLIDTPMAIVNANRVALIDTIRAARVGRFSFRSTNPADFSFFCRVAYAWGNCVVIAEELADVTTPGKAPLGWGMVVRRGRDRALTVYGVTQRPAESDKTIMGNVTRVHCCMLPRAGDRAYMAREMDIDQARIDALQPLDWIEREGMTIRSGKLKF